MTLQQRVERDFAQFIAEGAKIEVNPGNDDNIEPDVLRRIVITMPDGATLTLEGGEWTWERS